MKTTISWMGVLLAVSVVGFHARPALGDYDVKNATVTAQENAAFRSRYQSVNLFQEALEQKRDAMEKERDEYEDALRRYGPDNDKTRSAKKRSELTEKEYRRVLKKADKASTDMLRELKKG